VIAIEGEDISADDPWISLQRSANIEAQPPFNTAEEAVEAGDAVASLWKGVTLILFTTNVLPHVDTFKPRESE
jgi:hypothetical protein